MIPQEFRLIWPAHDIYYMQVFEFNWCIQAFKSASNAMSVLISTRYIDISNDSWKFHFMSSFCTFEESNEAMNA